MKNFVLTTLLVATAVGLSSCCCLLGSKKSYKTKETYVARYKTVTKEVQVATGAKGCIETQTVQQKVPVYKTRYTTHYTGCVRTYCARDGACGTPGENVVKMSTSQAGVGSPHIGLVPTMKPLAP
jgi:hypothetical protein